MNTRLLQKAYDVGFDFEKRYHGCSQCAVAAVYEIFPDLKNDDVFKAASGHGGGVGLSNLGNCGALTGGVMVLSQVYGRELKNIEDPERVREAAFRLAHILVKKFLEEYGTITCGEIQTKLMGRAFNLWDQQEKELFERSGGHTTACTSVVGNAARWTAEIILNQREGAPTR
jgi:C_GCAxxG_C_C family probable redox protein